MPLYEYECQQCGRFEKIQKFSDRPLRICPTCGKKGVERLLSAPAIQFKGSGWYITDYARKGEGKADSKGESTGDSKSDSKGESKSESKSEKSSGDKAASSDSSSSSSTPQKDTSKKSAASSKRSP